MIIFFRKIRRQLLTENRFSKNLFYAVGLLLILLLTSCYDIVDCIINRTPVLIEKELKVGIVNEFYSDFVLAEIKNDPDDNGYDYYFDVIGDLPNGIEWYVDYRKVYFEGTPTESGRFYFTVELYVDGEYYDGETDSMRDPLCDNETSRSFVIIIN